MFERILNMFRSSPEAAPTPTPAPEVAPEAAPVKIDERATNLVYQDYGSKKGGSDSDSKLAVIKLPDLNGKRFLDLGCNAGFFCSYASDQGAIYTLGVDNSDKVIEIARERRPDLDFRGGGWDRFPDGKFDVVICLSAIHYAKDAAKLAEDIRSALNPDGVFVLEGGLVGAEAPLWTDTLIPAWREVGDKVRHLSKTYVERHLLRNFQWEVLSESISQGGDPVVRYVMHARQKSQSSDVARPVHRLCPVEFAQGLAISAPAIHDKQPSAAYVRALGEGGVPDAARVEAVLANAAHLEQFIDDLYYALGTHNAALQLKGSLSDALTASINARLEARGVKVEKA